MKAARAPVAPPTARSIRVALRYPAKRTFDGVRPTQKVLDILKAEGPMGRDQLWERCKISGMPSKTYMKHLTRFLHQSGRIVIRPAGTPYEYLINFMANSALKHESREPRPKWRPTPEEELLESELDEVEAAAEAADIAEKKKPGAKVLETAAEDDRSKKRKAVTDSAISEFEKAI